MPWRDATGQRPANRARSHTAVSQVVVIGPAAVNCRRTARWATAPDSGQQPRTMRYHSRRAGGECVSSGRRSAAMGTCLVSGAVHCTYTCPRDYAGTVESARSRSTTAGSSRSTKSTSSAVELRLSVRRRWPRATLPCGLLARPRHPLVRHACHFVASVLLFSKPRRCTWSDNSRERARHASGRRCA